MKLVNRYAAAVVFAVVPLALAGHSSAPLVGATACTNLTGLSLPDTLIKSATDVTEPYTTDANGGVPTIVVSAPFSFCRVEATLTPTADSDIHAEIWLPAPEHWNGKFEGVGNGGLTGGIWHTSMVRPLQAGYAVANSDLGHVGSTAGWSFGHPEKVIDYAYRADHLTAQTAKAVLQAYYGTGPRRSYFHGCSNGGHEALMEAQRYPDDYEAIIAGAPWNQWTHQDVEWISRALLLENFNAAKLPMITNAVVAQCGAGNGGVGTDGYLNDPRVCHFQPRVLQCAGADNVNCLTAQEVTRVEKVYAGPSNSKTGQNLFPGLERGSEFLWRSFETFVVPIFQNMVFESNPTWNFHTFDFSSDVDLLDVKLSAMINSTNPDLSAFRARGGKLIMWHGLSDINLPPGNSVNYYNSVVAVTGGGLDLNLPDARKNRRHGAPEDGLNVGRREALEETQDFFRLFMAPGVTHCGGGLGPNSSFAYTLGNAVDSLDADHDLLAALDRWVENDIAPDKLIASHFTSGVIDKTRPVCAYPQVAQYKGRGNPNIPSSFKCVNDWTNFNRDFTQELKRIALDLDLDNLVNLPQ